MLFFFLGKNVFWSIEIFDLLTYNVIWYFIDKYTKKWKKRNLKYVF